MKKVVQDLTSGGIDWQREKWQSGLGSKFIHQGEKNAAKYADEVIVLSKGVQTGVLLRLFPLHLVDEVVHCHGLRCKQRVAVHLALHKLRAADHGVNVLVGALPLPELSLHHADGRFCRGTVDALAFHAVHEMTTEALLTVLVRIRIVQHVVRADQLVVMCREDDLTISSGLLAPLHDFHDDGRCQLVVKIVQVTDIRLEVI